MKLHSFSRDFGIVAAALALASGLLGASFGVSQASEDAPAAKQEKAAKKLAPRDAEFLHHVGAFAAERKRLGELAMEKGSTNQVKELGKRLNEQNSRLLDDAKKLADGKGKSLAKDLPEEKEAALANLAKLAGPPFDLAFSEVFASCHSKAVDQFRLAAKSDDADIRAFAEKHLPLLQEDVRRLEVLVVKSAPRQP